MLEVVLVGVGALAVAAGVVLQRITGIGFGAASGPSLILLLGPIAGVQIFHVLAALCCLALLTSCWRRVDWCRTATLTATALAATPVGVLLAFGLPAAILQIAMGVVMLAALFTVDVIARSSLMKSRMGVVVTGVLSGVANAAVGQAGPLVGAYAVASRWPIDRYVASMQVCWFVVNVTAVLFKGLPPISPPLAIVLCGSLVVGFVVSHPVAKAVTRRVAVRCLFVVAIAGSVVVLGKGIGGLIWP